MAVALADCLAAPTASLLGLPAIEELTGSAAGLAGMALVVAGIVATVTAQSSMDESLRVGVDPSEALDLVTAGPFRLVRNPIFTATIVTAAGMTLMVPNLIAVASLPFANVAVEWQARTRRGSPPTSPARWP